MTRVEGDQKAPFSIATTPRCRGRALLLSLDCSILPLIRTLYCWVIRWYQVPFLKFLVWRDLELNTLPTRPIYIYIYIYIYIDRYFVFKEQIFLNGYSIRKMAGKDFGLSLFICLFMFPTKMSPRRIKAG